MTNRRKLPCRSMYDWKYTGELNWKNWAGNGIANTNPTEQKKSEFATLAHEQHYQKLTEGLKDRLNDRLNEVGENLESLVEGNDKYEIHVDVKRVGDKYSLDEVVVLDKYKVNNGGIYDTRRIKDTKKKLNMEISKLRAIHAEGCLYGESDFEYEVQVQPGSNSFSLVFNRGDVNPTGYFTKDFILDAVEAVTRTMYKNYCALPTKVNQD